MDDTQYVLDTIKRLAHTSQQPDGPIRHSDLMHKIKRPILARELKEILTILESRGYIEKDFLMVQRTRRKEKQLVYRLLHSTPMPTPENELEFLLS